MKKGKRGKPTDIPCHDHPNRMMVRLRKGLIACPQCGRVRAKKFSKVA